MLLKTSLQQLTEKAKAKANFNEDLKKFASVILFDWLTRCVEVANEGNKELTLVAFKADAIFENNKIRFFLQHGLAEYIERETSLKTSVKSYLVKKGQKEVQEVNSLEFETLFGESNILHFYVITINWE
jgi:DNA gyrase/topoisomerase IV subunit B